MSATETIIKAWSGIEIKSIDEDKRIIEGIATTPRTDRMEDIVEPLGMVINGDIPLKFQHGRDAFVGDIGIGHVTPGTPTAKGIPFRAQIERDDEPGRLKDVLDYAWKAIKKRLTGKVSIGFQDLESEPIKGTFGTRFKKWEWLELSAVTIPANPDATITSIKNLDEQSRAATGNRVVRLTSPGASGNNGKPPGDKMTITERIGAYEAKRAANVARLDEITKGAGDEGRTKNEAEKEEFDTLRDEIKTIDVELVDLRDMQKLNAEKAKAVDTTTTTKAASETRSKEVRVALEEKLEPGILAARYAMCLGAARGDVSRALGLMETHYPKFEAGISVLKAARDFGQNSGVYIEKMMHAKAAVAAGTTAETTWAAPLVQYQNFSAGFIDYLRPSTIIGRLSLQTVPFKVRIPRQTSGGTGYWVGEGKPKPVTSFDFDTITFDFFKLAAISVITQELIRFSDPSAERLVRDGLAGAVIEKMDSSFIDPAVAAVANVSPAAITNGATSSASVGDTADDVRTDLMALWAPAVAANLPLTSAIYITTPSIAQALSLMVNALGQAEFPGMTGPNGGTLLGVPVIVSNHVPAGTFVLLFQGEVLLADDGTVSIDASDQASLQMLDNPTNDSDTPTPTTVVSMWQTNSVALRAERFINWARRRTQAVTYLTSVGWGGAVES